MSAKGKRLITILICLVLLAQILMMILWKGGGIAQPAEQQSRKAEGTIVIGVSVLDMSNPYYSESVRGIQNTAAGRGFQLIIKDPQSDARRQQRDVEEFIEQEVDAIIVAALSPETIDPLMMEARQRGIKVVAQSTKLENCDVHIAADEWDIGYKLGSEAADWIEKQMDGRADIAILQYSRIPEISNRVKGMLDGLHRDGVEVNVAACKEASTPEEGYKSTIELLKEHPQTKVILCINDGGALGAAKAMKELGKLGEDVFVGGIDATPEAIMEMRMTPEYRCSVDLFPYFTGTLDMEFIARLLEGRSVPDRYTINTEVIKVEG